MNISDLFSYNHSFRSTKLNKIQALFPEKLFIFKNDQISVLTQ